MCGKHCFLVQMTVTQVDKTQTLYQSLECPLKCIHVPSIINLQIFQATKIHNEVYLTPHFERLQA